MIFPAKTTDFGMLPNNKSPKGLSQTPTFPLKLSIFVLKIIMFPLKLSPQDGAPQL